MNDMERLLKEAFDEIVKEEYEKRPKEIPKHHFSLKFHWKMHYVLRSFKSKKKKKNSKKDIKKHSSLLELFRPITKKHHLTMISIIMLLFLGGTAVAAEPIISWLCDFYINQYEDHVKLQKKEEATVQPEKDFQKYQLTELPEGYYFEKEEYDEAFQKYQVWFSNGTDKLLLLKQTKQEYDSSEEYTSNLDSLEPVKLCNFTGYYTKDETQGILILSDDVYMLVLSGYFPKETLTELADKLELKNE